MRCSRTGLVACTAAVTLVLSTSPNAWSFTPDSAFDVDNFSAESAHIDNKYLPLIPGTQYVFDGQVTEDGETRAHRVIYTVTDLTKVVNGVRTRVIWDRDISDGELLEEELAFHAQDTDGTVWHLGEYPEEHEDGEFAGAPSTWIAGVAGARPGILMQAEPATGTPEYRHGYAPDVEFDDRAVVSKVGQKSCATTACYDDVIVIDERSAVQPDDGHQLKYHAGGVGIIRIEAVGGEAQETLLLKRIYHLNAKALASARAHVLEMEKRAYKLAKSKYGRTAPAE